MVKSIARKRKRQFYETHKVIKYAFIGKIQVNSKNFLRRCSVTLKNGERVLEIIEKIEEKSENSYFLPHRPIVKDDNITTKIRPVFDASARVTGQSSLNDLLYKGSNLIEQILDILDRFRRYPIELSADIEKAFLQLGITPKHKDFLRFFYPDEGEEIVYSHCRVVFGVSSSPLLAAVLAHSLENVPEDDTQLGSKLKLSFYVDNCVTGVNDIAQKEEFILRSNTSQGVKVALVRAKARVAPLKQWYWARTRDKASHGPIPIPLGYRGHLTLMTPGKLEEGFLRQTKSFWFLF
ncbi:integrase catalytic domain-containing protein [Trichonephila clavipes]|nr:integrase catalytic domain-containing protein [Trichonephila clavipes]